MTQKALLLLPMVIMIFLTFGVMLLMLKQRYRAVIKDGLDARYFKLYKGADLPDYLLKTTQHFHNLLEIPPLFYFAIVLLTVLNINHTFFIFLSWAYLFSRLVHSYIHITSNRLILRKNSFIVSMVILMIIWIGLAFEIITL